MIPFVGLNREMNICFGFDYLRSFKTAVHDNRSSEPLRHHPQQPAATHFRLPPLLTRHCSLYGVVRGSSVQSPTTTSSTDPPFPPHIFPWLLLLAAPSSSTLPQSAQDPSRSSPFKNSTTPQTRFRSVQQTLRLHDPRTAPS